VKKYEIKEIVRYIATNKQRIPIIFVILSSLTFRPNLLAFLVFLVVFLAMGKIGVEINKYKANIGQ